MSYVDRIIQPGEKILHRGRLHWIMHFPAVLILAGTALIALLFGGYGFTIYVVNALALISVVEFIRTLVRQWTTEIAVTDRRVILKTGLVSRHTREMNLAQVESVEVTQSILGRLFDYGTVQVHGSGVGLEAIRAVAEPIGLRSSITAR